MKLLLDQNLSHKLCAQLLPAFEGSAHVRDFGMATADDEAIWTLARSQGFTIVSFDADFAGMAKHRGPPPKVIWLRCRNQPSQSIADLLNERSVQLLVFEKAAVSHLELH